MCVFFFGYLVRVSILWTIEVQLQPYKVKDATEVPLYVNEVEGRIYQGQESSEVKLGANVKLV